MQTYTRRGALPTRTRTFCRLGSKRRFVATIEWLRLCPKAGPFPQLMQTLAMERGVYRPTCSGSVQTMPATEQRVSLPPRYRVVRHIANGGMASVWAAEDELLGRLVAVKLLARAYDADERARKRFLREARAAAKLGDCRHVVTVYDIGEHDDRAFIVMEHFAGGTLADRLRTGAPIPAHLRCAGCARRRSRSTARTSTTSSTATSSPPTSCSTGAAASRSATSASRPWPARRRSR